jgi:hypothetical protein
MVPVVVGEQGLVEPVAGAAQLGADRLEMGLFVGSRVDHGIGRRAAHQPGVRALEGPFVSRSGRAAA